MKKNITIDVPEGYSDVKYNSETGHIEFIKKDDKPHSWEEFCENYPVVKGEGWIHIDSDIVTANITTGRMRVPDRDRNLCISKAEAKAFLALMQLRQLRKVWVKDWEPNWNDIIPCIKIHCDTIKIEDYWRVQSTLSFPSHEMALEFSKDFRDLIEQAKPLL